eukprot:2219023-Alexandrium_andersonii.AAC.1
MPTRRYHRCPQHPIIQRVRLLPHALAYTLAHARIHTRTRAHTHARHHAVPTWVGVATWRALCFELRAQHT